MTQFEINVEPEGINLFDIAIKSHIYLTNQMTTSEVVENYGANHPGEDNDKKGGTSLDTFEHELETVGDEYNQERIKEEEEQEEFE